MAEEAQEKRVMSAAASQTEAAEFGRVVYLHHLKNGQDYQDLFVPEYWAHTSLKFKNRDRIEVYPDDGAFYAELLIVDCGRTWAKVVELSNVKLSKKSGKAELDRGGFKVIHRGPRAWSVVRKSDKAVMVEDQATVDLASAWLDDHLRRIEA